MSALRIRFGSTFSTTGEVARAASTAAGDFVPVETRTNPVAPATPSTVPPAAATAFSTAGADAVSWNRTRRPSDGPPLMSAAALAAAAAGDGTGAVDGLTVESARAGPASVSPDTTATARPEITRRPGRRPGPDKWMRYPRGMCVRSGYRRGPLNAWDLKVSCELAGLSDLSDLSELRARSRERP